MKTKEGKTAIQQIIDWLDEINDSPFALTASQTELAMVSQFKNKCESLLSKEKKQIIDAYSKGVHDKYWDQDEFPEEYYQETYPSTTSTKQ